MLRRLERRLQRFAVPNLTLGLIVLQVVTFALEAAQPGRVQSLMLVPDRVWEGEVWRLVTFLAVPPMTNVIFAFFFWYVFHLMGTSLELTWGALRYNVFLLIGYLATVAAALASPHMPATNAFLEASVFLAFAYLFPNFELAIFFILPIKIRYLAMLQWATYAWAVYHGNWLVLASVANFLVFFGGDIVRRMRHGQRRMATQVRRVVPQRSEPFHRCVVCGITDQSNPEMEFRYCSKCHGSCGYCSRHLHAHEHVPAPHDAPKVV